MGTRTMERQGTFSRWVGSQAASNSSLASLATTRPGVPDPSARESPGRSSRALSKSDAASPRPASRAGTGSRRSVGTQGTREAQPQVKSKKQKSN